MKRWRYRGSDEGQSEAMEGINGGRERWMEGRSN
uniref:Uncharacterized protein n=1 Tax=Anguilla anguilla TaxID=7936 RepID=A0A0E9TRB6_ANGAN